MGLMDFLKNELIDIIEWNEASGSDVMAWRYPRGDNEIKHGAKLVVREGQMAIFVNEGQLADVFRPGTHTLETKNLPILGKLKGWKYGFESPFKAEVYFVATRRFVDQKWGTQNPFMIRDKEFGALRIRSFGSYAIQVIDGEKFLRELLSTNPQFTTVDITGQLRNLIVTRTCDALASSGIPAIDMAGNLDELGEFVRQRIAPDFAAMGLGVPILLIENISLPPNVEEILDKRTSMGILGNLDAYMKFQAAEALGDAAKNPAGLAGLGASLAAGLAMGNHMTNAMTPGGAGSNVPPPLNKPASAAAWYAAIGGQQAGPFNDDVLREKISAGEVTRETPVWRQGMAGWESADKVAELISFFAAPPPLPK
ncbi:SPFH domain-containing protein [Candidatus Sumerlaeota bacterium]|nr:SPFH domain-containing protein [Candidatus Sumerlaeota bacterium]